MENNFSSFDILVLRNKLIQKKVENNVDMSLKWKISTLKSELVRKKHRISLHEAQILRVKNA